MGEDGFSPCPDCRPDAAAPADTATPAPAPEARGPEPAKAAGTVWVVDGRPRYHLADCMIIKDQDGEHARTTFQQTRSYLGADIPK